MLPTNFAGTPSEQPELEVVVREIGNWCRSHQALTAIDPRRIAIDLSFEPHQLIQALGWLVDTGHLKRVYKFETPAGYLLADDYESYLDVPPELRDRFDRTVQRSEGTIVPVYRGTA